MAEKELKGFGIDEMDEFHSEGARATGEFNPDGSTYKKPTPGRHRFRVMGGKDSRFLTNQECNWKGVQYCLHQLWIKLRLADGSEIMDFIHVPTWDTQLNAFRPMAQGQENRWANLLKALGFQVSQDNLWPPGFRLSQLDGREGEVDIVTKMKNDEPVMDRDGTPEVQVRMFGYHAIGSPGASSPNAARPVAAAGAGSTPSASPAAGNTAAPAKPKFEL